jgi:AcrR family transcriptional regulator
MPPPSQQERTQATRAALLAAGRRLFAERAYDDVPADEIAAAAGLTRGALYHHFADKRELFEAVFEQVEADLTTEVTQVLAADSRPLIVSGLRAFLDICTRPEIVHIALTEAPAVLGWQRWREIESRYGLGLVRAVLATNPAVEPEFLDAMSHVVVSALIEGALVIAHAPDRQAARDEAEAALTLLLDKVLPH